MATVPDVGMVNSAGATPRTAPRRYTAPAAARTRPLAGSTSTEASRITSPSLNSASATSRRRRAAMLCCSFSSALCKVYPARYSIFS